MSLPGSTISGATTSGISIPNGRSVEVCWAVVGHHKGNLLCQAAGIGPDCQVWLQTQHVVLSIAPANQDGPSLVEKPFCG